MKIDKFFFCFKLGQLLSRVTLRVKILVEVSVLYLHYLSKIRKLNMTPIFGEEKISGKLARVVYLDTLWVENFDEIALSHRVKEIQEVLGFIR